ncbi:MAG: transferase [Mucinivorans sp.]
MMTFAIDKPLILEQLKRQLNSLFLNSEHDFDVLDTHYEATLERTERCFAQTPNKYYQKDGQPFFSPYISTQYTIFLYYFANTIYKSAPSESEVCDKLYYLNKSLNSVDIYYAVALPDFFMCEHPVGSVMGRGKYGDGFAFFQHCTVGGNINEEYPIIGNNVTMFVNSKIIGHSHIGNNVFVGADSCVKDADVPDNSIVFGSSPHLIFKTKSNNKSGF